MKTLKHTSSSGDPKAAKAGQPGRFSLPAFDPSAHSMFQGLPEAENGLLNRLPYECRAEPNALLPLLGSESALF